MGHVPEGLAVLGPQGVDNAGQEDDHEVEGASLLGEAGFTHMAQLNHAAAVQLAGRLGKVKGVTVTNDTFFNEFALKLPKPAAQVVDALVEKRVLGGVPVSRLMPGQGLDNLLLVAANETNTEADMDAFAKALTEVLA